MGYQIAFAWSEKCEDELKAKGFVKREVYMKDAPPGMTDESNAKGNSEFFRMTYPPFQFITTSYCGACPE